MAVDTLLAKLSKVRKTGPDKWHACCPAHEDRSPSLAIKSLPDGRVLVHCFGGCDTEAVLGAVGLEFTDIMPPLQEHAYQPVRRPWTGDDALRCLSHEAVVVALCASDTLLRKPVDMERLCQAAGRLEKALEYIDGLG